MKLHRPKFTYWEDDHTKLLRKSKHPDFVNPVFYLKAHIRKEAKWPYGYFLNKRCMEMMKRDGPFIDSYDDCEKLVDIHSGKDAYIFCPGPSLRSIDLSLFSGKLTLAINSAGFAFDPVYWVMAESGYARWLVQQPHPSGRTVIATARVATVLRNDERRIAKRQKFNKVYVARWEEEMIVPPRTPAVSITNALVSAWEMGCPRAYIIGMDLSKPSGRPYAEGLPHTKDGADNPFDDQIIALRQFEFPDFEVINTSPYSKDKLENFRYISIDMLAEELSDGKSHGR